MNKIEVSNPSLFIHAPRLLARHSSAPCPHFYYVQYHYYSCHVQRKNWLYHHQARPSRRSSHELKLNAVDSSSSSFIRQIHARNRGIHLTDRPEQRSGSASKLYRRYRLGFGLEFRLRLGLGLGLGLGLEREIGLPRKGITYIIPTHITRPARKWSCCVQKGLDESASEKSQMLRYIQETHQGNDVVENSNNIIIANINDDDDDDDDDDELYGGLEYKYVDEIEMEDRDGSDLGQFHDTIYAVASGSAGASGVAVIRISGPKAVHCLKAMLLVEPLHSKKNKASAETRGTGKKAMGAGPGASNMSIMNGNNGAMTQSIPEPRFAALRKLYDPESLDLLDEALVLYFPGPRSFTGEDVVEFHVHGSMAVIDGVFQALDKIQHDLFEHCMETNGDGDVDSISLSGADQWLQRHYQDEKEWRVRPADRGEFTKRAFHAGKMDLTEVEGLADLLAAQTSEQRKLALHQLGGHMKSVYESWRQDIITCLANAEALLDFGEDIDDEVRIMTNNVLPKVKRLKESWKRYLKTDASRGELVRNGIKVTIAGVPNAGKSSLLNILASRPVAIVSPIAGTTRDVVQVSLNLGGFPVIVSDTAGIREKTDDEIEREGINRARIAMEDSDLTLFVHDPTQEDSIAMLSSMVASTGDANQTMIISNKQDLRRSQLDSWLLPSGLKLHVIPISCETGQGVDDLIQVLESRIKELVLGADYESIPLITRSRHRYHVEECVKALDRFVEGTESKTLPLDFATEELRIAARELGKITGAVDVEELLDKIFKDFCIGK